MNINLKRNPNYERTPILQEHHISKQTQSTNEPQIFKDDQI